MKPVVSTTLAIGVEFVRRSIRPILMLALVVGIIMLVLCGYLTTVSIWWWIAEVACIIWFLLGLTVFFLYRFLLRLVEPPLDRDQRRQVIGFVDKLERTSGTIQTPWFMIILRVAYDVVRRRGDNSFVAEVSRDTRSLTPDFIALQKTFKY